MAKKKSFFSSIGDFASGIAEGANSIAKKLFGTTKKTKKTKATKPKKIRRTPATGRTSPIDQAVETVKEFIAPPKPEYPPKPSRAPFTVKSADAAERKQRQAELRERREDLVRRRTPYNVRAKDADERARRQRTLRAKRRQLELRKQRAEYTNIKTDRTLRPSERAKRYQNYLRRYGKKQNPYPADETREFWRQFREAGGS